MAYERLTDEGLDYFPCRYGRSRMLFRGPKRKLGGRFITCIGGTETYGRFVERPYPDLIADLSGLKTINLGCPHAGLDVFASDPAIHEIGHLAECTVIQVVGAQNMSNAFYSVHPRRNDRFLKAGPRLRGLYPKVDFTEFHFTGHLLSTLAYQSPAAFEVIRSELRATWLGRMQCVLARINSPVVLLWMSTRSPDRPIPGLGHDEPQFIDRSMLDELRGSVARIVEVVASTQSRAEGTDGMIFAELERPAAALLPGPRMHAETARAVSVALEDLGVAEPFV